MMADWLARIFSWLREVGPSLLAAFTFGFKAGAKNKAQLEKKIVDTKLTLELMENEKKVIEEFGILDDSDIVRNISKGRKPTDH